MIKQDDGILVFNALLLLYYSITKFYDALPFSKDNTVSLEPISGVGLMTYFFRMV